MVHDEAPIVYDEAPIVHDANGQVDVNKGKEVTFHDAGSTYTDGEFVYGHIPWHADGNSGKATTVDTDGSDSDGSDSDSAGSAGPRQLAKYHILWQFAMYGTAAVLFHLRVL
jgi:hypothetical protein